MEKNNKNKIPLALSFENPLRALFTLAEQQPNRYCLVEPRGNMVRKYTYKELAELVETIARGIAKTKNSETKPIGIAAQSSFRTIAAHFGALLGGGKTILIPINSTAEEQLQIIADNQVELLILDNLEAGSDLVEQLPFLPQLRQLWILGDEPDQYQAQVSTLGWHDMLHLANQGKRRITLEQQLEALSDSEKLCRFYSRNDVSEFQHHDYSLSELADEVKFSIERVETDYPSFNHVSRFLSIIPFNRVMGHVEGIYLPLLTGRMLMAVDREEAWKSATLPYDADCLVASSLFLSNAAEKVRAEVSDHGGIAQFSFQKNLERLKKMARRRKDKVLDGSPMVNFIAGKTVHYILFRKLKETFGGDIKLCFAIDDDLRFENRLFYRSVAMPLLETNEVDLIVKASEDITAGLAFNGVRGTQLAKNQDVLKLKIVS
ncbi:MAG: AMP-binding protein [Rickettsiales bacterium]|nr:AMP-binding protein [Rickettsiales bacterium]